MHRSLIAAAAAAGLLVSFSAPALAQDLEIPEGGYAVSSDSAQLPEAVRLKREQLLAIAKSGDIEALGPILVTDKTPSSRTSSNRRSPRSMAARAPRAVPSTSGRPSPTTTALPS